MIGALFFGERGGIRLLQSDQGGSDDGVPVTARGETVPAGPGVGGEAIFPTLLLGTTSDCDALVDVTPIISGHLPDGTPFETELETQHIVLAATSLRRSVQHKFGLTVPVVVGGVELGRQVPRATWFRPRIVAVIHDDGELILEGIGVEVQVVREAVPIVALPGS